MNDWMDEFPNWIEFHVSILREQQKQVVNIANKTRKNLGKCQKRCKFLLTFYLFQFICSRILYLLFVNVFNVFRVFSSRICISNVHFKCSLLLYQNIFEIRKILKLSEKVKWWPSNCPDFSGENSSLLLLRGCNNESDSPFDWRFWLLWLFRAYVSIISFQCIFFWKGFC